MSCLTKAEVFICHPSSFHDEILWKRFSTGILMLPDESDVVDYINEYSTKWLKLKERLSVERLSSDSISVSELIKDDPTLIQYFAFEFDTDSTTDEFFRKMLDNQFVTPSVFYLDGKVVTCDMKKYWIVFKTLGELTRVDISMSRPPLIGTLDFLEGTNEGIHQWGHAVNEIAFCLGIAPKYGD